MNTQTDMQMGKDSPENDREWRRFEQGGGWNAEYAEHLLNDIANITNEVQLKEIKKINILLVGQISAGKSSFINTVAAIDKGRIAEVTVAGEAGSSMTNKLKNFRPYGKLKNFKLYDTMGFEQRDSYGLNTKDILFLVKGNVPLDYKFSQEAPIDEESPKFQKDPKLKDKIHCVVFVMDAQLVGEENITSDLLRKIRVFLEQIQSQDIPRILLITQIDRLSMDVEKDVTITYENKEVKKAVKIAQELFHFPERNIFPVQNYSNEMERDIKKEILTLLALRQMMYFATDYLNEQRADSDDEKEIMLKEDNIDLL